MREATCLRPCLHKDKRHDKMTHRHCRAIKRSRAKSMASRRRCWTSWPSTNMNSVTATCPKKESLARGWHIIEENAHTLNECRGWWHWVCLETERSEAPGYVWQVGCVQHDHDYCIAPQSQEELDEWVNSQRNRGTNLIGFAWAQNKVTDGANVRESTESPI